MISHWVVEGCCAPGVRKIATLCPAKSAAEAFAITRDFHGDAYSHLVAYPNYIMTGEISPVIWEEPEEPE